MIDQARQGEIKRLLEEENWEAAQMGGALRVAAEEVAANEAIWPDPQIDDEILFSGDLVAVTKHLSEWLHAKAWRRVIWEGTGEPGGFEGLFPDA